MGNGASVEEGSAAPSPQKQAQPSSASASASASGSSGGSGRSKVKSVDSTRLLDDVNDDDLHGDESVRKLVFSCSV